MTENAYAPPTFMVVQLWFEGEDTIMTPYGEATGRELSDVVLIGISLVNACARRRQAVCGFAQRLLRAGIAYVTRDGHFVVQNETRRIAYELFPALFTDGLTPLYIGVKRAEDAW